MTQQSDEREASTPDRDHESDAVVPSGPHENNPKADHSVTQEGDQVRPSSVDSREGVQRPGTTGPALSGARESRGHPTVCTFCGLAIVRRVQSCVALPEGTCSEVAV